MLRCTFTEQTCSVQCCHYVYPTSTKLVGSGPTQADGLGCSGSSCSGCASNMSLYSDMLPVTGYATIPSGCTMYKNTTASLIVNTFPCVPLPLQCKIITQYIFLLYLLTSLQGTNHTLCCDTPYKKCLPPYSTSPGSAGLNTSIHIPAHTTAQHFQLQHKPNLVKDKTICHTMARAG